jgi:hypothetical protein
MKSEETKNPRELDSSTLHEIREAARVLESTPAWLTQISRLEAPLGRLAAKLPAPVDAALREALEKVLATSWNASLWNLSAEPTFAPAWVWPTLTGAAGGALGFLGMAGDLAASTPLILRGIAKEALTQGFDPREEAVKQECLSVFALGSPRRTEDDGADTAYYALRIGWAQVLRPGGPAAGMFVRAGVAPGLGALGAATLNGLMTRHFCSVAKAHFTLRRLEDRFGRESVEAAYQAEARLNRK